MNELIYAGKNLTTEFGCMVDSVNSWVKPERSVDSVEVPGRDGDLIIDKGRFQNVTVPFRCFMMTGWRDNYLDLMNFLGSKTGYNRLEFNGDPNIFRMARILTNVSPNPTAFLRHGNFILSFDCKPQRWLMAGESAVSFTADSTITNPTGFAAKPLIKVTGNGNVTINGTKITTAGLTDYVYVDCDIMECYKGTTILNDKVSFSTNDFPVLGAGTNIIDFGTGVTKVEITPRWWTI